MQQLDIETAWGRLQPLLRAPFGSFASPDTMTLMRRNKGRAGQLLEVAIGSSQGSRLLDFVDGDLKTYKCDPLGRPRETMAIHQVGGEVDDLVRRTQFKDTALHVKTKRLIVAGVCKDSSDPAAWYVACASLVDGRPGTDWYEQFSRSYGEILEHFHVHISRGDMMFHTSQGEYIQLRTKDSAPYRPLVSTVLRRTMCDKNVAFYFKKRFMEELNSRQSGRGSTSL